MAKFNFSAMAGESLRKSNYKRGLMQVHVGGLKELDEALRALDLDLKKKTMKKASKAAMAPVLVRVQANLKTSYKTGGLYDTARMTSSTNLKKLAKRGRKAAMITSVSVGRRSKKDGITGHQALNLEYGTNGTTAQPFMRPAIQGKEKVVIMRFRHHLKKGIEKSAKTQNKRNRKLQRSRSTKG